MKCDEVVRLLHVQQKDLVEKYHIVSLFLFGSIVREGPKPNSPVKILVKFARPMAFFQFLDLKRHLETLLGCKVDMGKPDWLKPQFKNGVFKEAIRVF